MLALPVHCHLHRLPVLVLFNYSLTACAHGSRTMPSVLFKHDLLSAHVMNMLKGFQGGKMTSTNAPKVRNSNSERNSICLSRRRVIT
jgi:hypothetical protein